MIYIDIFTRLDSLLKEWPGGCVVDLTDDKDPTDEDRDTGIGDLTGVSVSLGGEIFSEEMKSQESNIGGSDNTGDRGKTTGRAIKARGGGIASYACMIYGSFWKCSGTEDTDGRKKKSSYS
nr:hypothetical protein [Tanacetum cinerariifolium]